MRDGFSFGIGLVQRDIVGNGVEWSQIGRVGEAIEHGRGGGVHLIHWRQAEDEFDRSQEAGLIVLGRDDSVATGVRAGYIAGGPVAAYMVPTCLGIIFNSEDTGLFPELAVTDRFDD